MSKYSLSNDGKQPMTQRGLSALNMTQLKSILIAIGRTNNLVDITSVKAIDLPDADLLTYSFPCQDLSKSGHWHKNEGGIDRNANNRSTLLWQIERILKEYIEQDKTLPSFLLMENVSEILSDKHKDNFIEWCEFLESLGYVNQIYTLDSRNFGVPQSRIRTYMMSIKVNNEYQQRKLEQYLFENNLEHYQSINFHPLSEYLKLDYNNDIYRHEAIESTPTFTPSREKILKLNRHLAKDNIAFDNTIARTITTKQDRHPNSGIILYDQIKLVEKNKMYRNLTPRECFLLMGFDEKDFDNLMRNNIVFENDRKILPNSKLIRLAGNSIVVNVLEKIFSQMLEIEKTIINNQFLKS
ncbi:DNA (cytosine-5-)-methyltransferase [Staphylococcus hominis]|uniref:DNA (cytosine-5-)-methyltransferase n=1 Tax=Staphylococcus hominis TaxID=1290 RepID=UPI003018990A